MGKLKESIIINGILPASDVVFKTGVSKWYRQLNKMLNWSPEEIQKWQLDGLKNLIRVAYNDSVYYHELFDKIGLKPEDVKSIQDIETIPPLTKDILRERFDDILLKTRDKYNYITGSTGGSTGNPTQYIKDRRSWGVNTAYNIIMWKRTGYFYGDKFLALGSASIFPTNKKSTIHDMYYRLKGKYPYNAMNLSNEVLEDIIHFIKKNDIHYIYGYASSIFLVAKYIVDNHLENEVCIKACFPTSEILTDIYRQTIKRAFNCHINDAYGASDGGIVAHKIDDEVGYKACYNTIIQLKKHQGMPDSYGTALLTDVTNVVFPFIRYELGDELELTEGYNNFHNGQVVKKVVGRTSDIIELENGRSLTSPGFTILFKDLNVKGYRIYKSNPMEITLEIVKLPDFTSDEEKLIIDTMHKHAGNDIKILIEYKDEIITRKNGKNLFFLNDKES